MGAQSTGGIPKWRYITSETVPSGIYVWNLDTTWMNYVYVKDKEPDPEYTITFDGKGGTSPSSQTTTNQKINNLTKFY